MANFPHGYPINYPYNKLSHKLFWLFYSRNFTLLLKIANDCHFSFITLKSLELYFKSYCIALEENEIEGASKHYIKAKVGSIYFLV